MYLNIAMLAALAALIALYLPESWR